MKNEIPKTSLIMGLYAVKNLSSYNLLISLHISLKTKDKNTKNKTHFAY